MLRLTHSEWLFPQTDFLTKIHRENKSMDGWMDASEKIHSLISSLVGGLSNQV